MPTLFLSQDTLRVSIRSERLLVAGANTGHPPEEIRLEEIERVVVSGKPVLTTAVLTAFMDHGIPVCFVTNRGRWRGSLTSGDNRNGGRRLLQYERSRDASFALPLAKRLISAKLRNSRRVLQRLAANRGRQVEQEQRSACGLLSYYTERASAAISLSELRAIEGLGASCYFKQIGTFFPPTIPFPSRTRRPPRDPANALLSYGYSILTGEVETAIRLHGLDIAIGCLHRSRANGAALAFDLMEPLRAPIVDLTVLNLVNHKIVRPESHFEIGPEDGGTYLNGEGRKAFFRGYEETMQRKFARTRGTQTVTFREMVDDQVVQYLKSLEKDLIPSFFLLP